MATYLLDGIALDDPAGRWGLRTGTAIRILPAKRAAQLVRPGRNGYVPDSNAAYEGGSAMLRMIVKAATHDQMRLNAELLMGIIGQPGLRTLKDQYGAAPSATNDREATVQVVSSIAPEMTTQRSVEFDLVLDVPGTFWRSTASVDSSTAVLTATATNYTLTNHAGGTAPMDDALIRIKGGFSGAWLTDQKSGDTLTINTACTDTEYIIIDTANWTARKVTTDTWTGGTNVDALVVSNRGMGSMFNLRPTFTSSAASYVLRASVTTPVGTPSITVRSKRAFL